MLRVVGQQCCVHLPEGLESRSSDRSNSGGGRRSGYVVVVVIVVVVVVAVVGHLCVLHLVSQTSESSSGSRRNCGGGHLEWLRGGAVLVVGEVVLLKILSDVFPNTGFESHYTSIYSVPPPKKPKMKWKNWEAILSILTSIADLCNFGRTPLRTANSSPLIGGVKGNSAPSSCQFKISIKRMVA